MVYASGVDMATLHLHYKVVQIVGMKGLGAPEKTGGMHFHPPLNFTRQLLPECNTARVLLVLFHASSEPDAGPHVHGCAAQDACEMDRFLDSCWGVVLGLCRTARGFAVCSSDRYLQAPAWLP